MAKNHLIQLVAVVVCIASLAASGALLDPILKESEDHSLRYTDVHVEGSPPIVAVGTAIGALRGIIVDVLWMRVQYMKEKGLFFDANTDADLITKLQPRFGPVWSFHGHNMAYNISVATHTVEERWSWVNKGIDLVRNSGLRYNPNDILLYKDLSFWFAHKIDGISDDAHLYYKTEFCREWHRLLGPPPVSHPDRIAWMKVVADAPETLADAEIREPGVGALVEALRDTQDPFTTFVKFDLDKEFLGLYADWVDMKSTQFARIRDVQGTLRRAADDGDQVALRMMEFDSIASEPANNRALETLIAYARKKVLREDYNMQPQLMYEYINDLGPIDWRAASAHSLYWARVGSQVAEKRANNNDTQYHIINNDRLQVQAMQDLARYGLMSFDPATNDLPSRMPDRRWVPVVDKFFEHLYIKHQEVPGWGPDTFIPFHQNFLSSAVRQLYRSGHHEDAQRILDERLDVLYGTGALIPNSEYSIPLENFVQKEEFNEYDMQPHVATTNVQNALYYALRAGLGRGDQQLYDRVKKFADDVLRYFKVNQYNDFVNKFGEERIAGIIGSLEEGEVFAMARLMTDDSVRLDERLRIWHTHTNNTLRVKTYDDVLPAMTRALNNSLIFVARVDDEGNRIDPVTSYFPEPDGIESYRAFRARLLEEFQRREAESTSGQMRRN